MHTLFRTTAVCVYKDFKFYYQSKMIYLIVLIYAALIAGLTFYATDFVAQTDPALRQFFKLQTDILPLFVPALTMRLWADEYKHNTLEILLSQPVSWNAFVWGKFLAAWAVTGIMLVSTFGIWLLSAFYVPLDNSWILWSYVMSFLMAGALCAVCSLVASLCYNALGAFIMALGVCCVLVYVRFDSLWENILGEHLIIRNFLGAFDFQKQFFSLIDGQISIAAVSYFVLLIAASLGLSAAAVDYKRN